MLRPRLETALCALFAVLTIVTAVWPSWIEGITGLEPDGGNGAVEWLIVLVLGVIAVGLGLVARFDFRQARLRASREPAPAEGTAR